MKSCIMKIYYLSFFLIVFFCSVSVVHAQDKDARLEAFKAKREFINENVMNKPFQDFSIKSGRKKFTNESLKGKVVFLNFWFENCPPCRAEFRTLNWLYKTYKDNDQFEFISLSFEKFEAIDRVKAQFNLEFPMHYATSEYCNKLTHGSGYPTNIILDKDGVVRYFLAGGHRNEGEVFNYFSEKIIPLIDEYIKK